MPIEVGLPKDLYFDYFNGKNGRELCLFLRGYEDDLDSVVCSESEYLNTALALLREAKKVETPEQFDKEKVLNAAITHLWTPDEMKRIGIWLIQEALEMEVEDDK